VICWRPDPSLPVLVPFDFNENRIREK
jgi:hypothetical protein